MATSHKPIQLDCVQITMMRVFVLRDENRAKMLWAFLKANWKPLADQNKPLAVTITEYKSKRSIEQNKRYWAVLQQISEQAFLEGVCYSTDAWHEYFKRKFIGCIDLPDGNNLGQSSTMLTVAEFADYMTKVESYASGELGVEIL